MLPDKLTKKIIKKYKLGITSDDVKLYEEQAKTESIALSEFLVKKELIDEEKLYKKTSEFLNIPFVDLKNKEIPKDILSLIPSPLAGTHQVIAFEKNEDILKLAMTDPTDMQTVEFLRRKTGLEPKVYITTAGDLKSALHRYHAELADDLQIVKHDKEGADTKKLKKAAEELPIINIVNKILEHAVYENASDIHMEPAEKEINIRYRIDGILKPVMTLPKETQNGIVARIKILSNLKLDEHMVPQDGRFKIKIQEEKVAFRVSVLPVYDGEKIVMRLLHEGAKPLDLEQLGFLPKQKAQVEDAIKKPHGMILVTGPTGSGKTTTLYSLLGILNQPGVNISTVEDPIEYRIAGVNQSQINPKVGFTFALGLRSLLRQDPNIIMVGEIRDQETAEIAINSAMTGHLVLSTLHTNDAPTTLPRLADMGVPSFLIAYTANIVVAQRLARRICPNCKKEHKLTKTEINELKKFADNNKIEKLFKDNIEGYKNNNIFYQGEGCKKCGQTGYKGRLGLYEVMEINDEIIKKINQNGNANEIKEIARKNGMLTMMEDGLIKAKMGQTTIGEMLRVSKE